MGRSPREQRRFEIVLGLTVARVPLAIIYAAMLVFAPHTWPIVALGVLLLLACETTDILDGLLARRLGVVTEWGAMLDPLTDSITRLLVFWALALTGLISPLVPLVMALRDVIVAYCRIVLTRSGATVAAKRSGKIKAIVQAVAAIIATLGPLTIPLLGRWTVTVLSWAVILVTAASAAEYVVGAVRATTGARPSGNEVRDASGGLERSA